MLSNIKLHNFKCFENLDLPLTNLNLLSGINSMGKSTIIQALLLLRQTNDQNSISKGVYLNGKYVKIGTGKDLLYSEAKDDIITISLHNSQTDLSIWNLEYKSDSDFLNISDSSDVVENKLDEISLFKSGFEYISAERFGPRLIYDKSYHEVNVNQQMGSFGEYAVHFLQTKGSEPISNKKVQHPNNSSLLIISQVESWLSEISPNVKLVVEDYGHANAVGITFNQSSSEGAKYYTAPNVGFGLSYVLSIIVALVKASAGDLVILENPEAHLHPKGQRKIGELISRVASGNVQVILETHSDHILNGIRLGVKNNLIEAGSVNLYYFGLEEEISTLKRVIENPKIKNDGRLDFWPKGFFDEWDNAINEIF